MYDSLSVLSASATVTATTNGAAYDLHTGTPNHGIYARVFYSEAANTAGDTTVTFKVQHSDTTTSGDFVDLTSGAADTITLDTTPQEGEVFIPIQTQKRYVRLVCTIAGGTSPTITYSGEIGLSRP